MRQYRAVTGTQNEVGGIVGRFVPSDLDVVSSRGAPNGSTGTITGANYVGGIAGTPCQASASASLKSYNAGWERNGR